MPKIKFPGLNNMTLDEVKIMAKVCRAQGDNTEKTLEIITCIDDCLTILRSAALINKRRGNRLHRVTAADVIANRIMNYHTPTP